MRACGVAIAAFVLAATSAAAEVVKIPEAHLLLVDRSVLKPADPMGGGPRFEGAEKTLYRELMARHGADLILDASAAPAHWSGLDVTGEAEAALHAAIPEWSPPPGAPASVAATKAPAVRMLFAEVAPSDLSDDKFHETLEHIAAGQGATLVVDKKAVVMGAPAFDVTQLVRSTVETYRTSGTLPLVVGGPDLPTARVAVLDRAALVRNSAAGRDMAVQLHTLSASARAEIARELTAFKKEGARLKAQIPSIPPGERLKVVQDFETRQRAISEAVRERQTAFDAAVTAAQKKIEAAAGPIVMKIVGEDRANMMLDRTAVVACDEALDITPSVIAKLDATLPHVEVTLAPAAKK